MPPALLTLLERRLPAAAVAQILDSAIPSLPYHLAPAVADLLGDGATWLPGVAARGWVRDGSAAEGVIVLVWTAGCLAAGAVRLARSDA